MYKVIGFDMDGTIIDSDDIIIKSWVELFKLYKPKDYKIDIERIRGYSGPPIEYAINDAFKELDYDFILSEYRLRTKKYYETDLKTFPNCVEIITKLHNEGFKLAIITCKNKEMTLYSLKKYGILDYFSMIITSSDLKNNKPDPEGINIVLNTLHIKNEDFLYVGDSNNDFYTAKNANVDSILLKLTKRNYNEDVLPLKFLSSYNELYEFIHKSK